jgi:hypothetical protein
MLRVASPSVTDETSLKGTRSIIHGERLVDDNPHVRVSMASVELPDGVEFEQYVFSMRRCAMPVVLDDAHEHILPGGPGDDRAR